MAQSLEEKFSAWLETMNAHGEHNKPRTLAAAVVHDEIWTAQHIADSRFGEGSRTNADLVLKIYDRLATERRVTHATEVYEKVMREIEEK